MAIRAMQHPVRDNIPINTVLLSVSDKQDLQYLVLGLMDINPNVKFMSTGGTFTKIDEYLGESSEKHLMKVSDYTGFPEMEGGLVKTLHPKIHAGILGERNNPEHQRYLKEELDNAAYIDLVVGNLYPFEEMVAKVERGDIDKDTSEPYNFESARGNVDIGGPSFLRGVAKNFPSCAALTDPEGYGPFIEEVKENNGFTTFGQRLELAKRVFAMTQEYDNSILNYMLQSAHDAEDIKSYYKFSD